MILHKEFEQLVEKAIAKQVQAKHQIRVCVGTGCVTLGSEQLLVALKKAIEEKGLKGSQQLPKIIETNRII